MANTFTQLQLTNKLFEIPTKIRLQLKTPWQPSKQLNLLILLYPSVALKIASSVTSE